MNAVLLVLHWRLFSPTARCCAVILYDLPTPFLFFLLPSSGCPPQLAQPLQCRFLGGEPSPRRRRSRRGGGGAAGAAASTGRLVGALLASLVDNATYTNYTASTCARHCGRRAILLRLDRELAPTLALASGSPATDAASSTPP
eukprot:CAMPEP_0113590530 /NCGR_PEP_ID=MMETSP0015_2-20120614/36736_1 /TAXON_ID=2838 /ORGANISM="Odontella" /LENGTH=142 /DNA_ID=CAMNT_0000496753 /DNA_START=110 /DNA_END=534 /DNA_ORIENTATION=+ /assembly_acc=CAM_ASM_000160